MIATKKKNDTRRYRAINQTNTATIEIRIFKSSLSIQTVQATLGLVHASIEYTRTLRARDAIKDKGWTWSAFVAWVRKQGIYGPLVAEMERLDVLDDTVTPGRVAADPESDYESDCDCGGNNDCNGNCSCDECDGACYEPDDDY